MTDEETFGRLFRQITEARPMRIDYDLIRLILLDAEGVQAIDLSSYTEEQIIYHMSHLISGGYASGIPLARFTGITWKGHEFLANARNDIIWNRAMAHIAKHGGSVSLEVLTTVLTQIALQELDLSNPSVGSAE